MLIQCELKHIFVKLLMPISCILDDSLSVVDFHNILNSFFNEKVRNIQKENRKHYIFNLLGCDIFT